MLEKLTYIYPEPLAESWFCKEVILPGFIKLVENPMLEQNIPEFGSYFQAKILPYLLQNMTFNTTLPAEFPPKVNSAANIIMNHSITINNPVTPKLVSCFGKHWISTGLYAIQGQIVRVKVPSSVIGEFDIQVGSHNHTLII